MLKWLAAQGIKPHAMQKEWQGQASQAASPGRDCCFG